MTTFSLGGGKFHSNISIIRLTAIYQIGYNKFRKTKINMTAGPHDPKKGKIMAKIITVASAKGGVGKTTTTINVASVLAKQGKKVLVIDADSQGDSTLLLTGKNWTDPAFKTKGLFNMLKSWDQDKDLSIPVDRYISPTNVENCDIIASNAHTASIPKLLETLAENSDGVSMYEVLIYRLYQIEAIYDYIIIDTRPSKDERLVKSSLIASDYVIIPCTYNDLAIRGMVTTVTLCKELEKEEECEIKILGIVMTMVSERTTTTKLLKNDLAESEYAKYLFKTEIHRGQSIENSVFVNLPVIINEPSSKQSQEYRDLSREIQERIRQDNREEN